MQHPRGQAGQTLQARWCIQVAQQGRDAGGAQFGLALRAGGQGQDAHAAGQLMGGALADIAATHNQNALTAKSGRQCA
jgi:hypothetical protein